MRPSLFLVLLLTFATGCQPDDRVDAGDPQHTTADDYESDTVDRDAGSEGTQSPPIVPQDTMSVREALDDTMAVE